jgi:hypothetical protein
MQKICSYFNLGWFIKNLNISFCGLKYRGERGKYRGRLDQRAKGLEGCPMEFRPEGQRAMRANPYTLYFILYTSLKTSILKNSILLFS